MFSEHLFLNYKITWEMWKKQAIIHIPKLNSWSIIVFIQHPLLL